MSSEDVPAGEAVPLWYACYTRARHEKQVDRLLQERGVESYLPLVARTSQWKDRRKLVQFPLFPSYVFARFPLPELPRLLNVPGVVNVVRSYGKPLSVPADELDNVRRFVAGLASGEVETELVPFIAEGQWVVVTSGPFEGVRGIVVERRSRRRLRVGLQEIAQGMEIDIDVRLLKPIPETAT